MSNIKSNPDTSSTKSLVAVDDSTKQVVKKKRNRPDLEKFGEENAKPGDNSRYLRLARASMNLPPIDISDPKQVEDRINAYFDFCEKNDKKPQKIEMAGWLGIHIDTLHSWANGECRAETHSVVIKKADAVLHSLWVDYMMNGKVNPGSGIFLGKNMFGYRDVIDIAPSAPSPLGEVTSPERLAEKYADLPED